MKNLEHGECYVHFVQYPNGKKWICKLMLPLNFGVMDVAVGVGITKEESLKVASERYELDFK